MSIRTPHPSLKYNLALIGGRGCGKSSVGKRLARTNRNFMLFSLDALIRYESKAASIPEIVEARGWSGFRELEFEVVKKVSAFLARFGSIPDMLELDHLTVSGDVTFGRGGAYQNI